jgi:hypothetical protein
VAVSHHDTTPLSGEDSVHHLRGRNPGTSTRASSKCSFVVIEPAQ